MASKSICNTLWDLVIVTQSCMVEIDILHVYICDNFIQLKWTIADLGLQFGIR